MSPRRSDGQSGAPLRQETEIVTCISCCEGHLILLISLAGRRSTICPSLGNNGKSFKSSPSLRSFKFLADGRKEEAKHRCINSFTAPGTVLGVRYHGVTTILGLFCLCHSEETWTQRREMTCLVCLACGKRS